jgi:hypothetical protein
MVSYPRGFPWCDLYTILSHNFLEFPGNQPCLLRNVWSITSLRKNYVQDMNYDDTHMYALLAKLLLWNFMWKIYLTFKLPQVTSKSFFIITGMICWWVAFSFSINAIHLIMYHVNCFRGVKTEMVTILNVYKLVSYPRGFPWCDLYTILSHNFLEFPGNQPCLLRNVWSITSLSTWYIIRWIAFNWSSWITELFHTLITRIIKVFSNAMTNDVMRGNHITECQETRWINRNALDGLSNHLRLLLNVLKSCSTSIHNSC